LLHSTFIFIHLVDLKKQTHGWWRKNMP